MHHPINMLSPIEKQFLAAWQRHYPFMPLITELPVYGGRYRIDFAHPPTKVAVELDGYEYHKDRDTFTSDRQRDRALQRDGWRVLHFSGREVYQNADACVQEVYAVIAQSPPIAQPALAAQVQPNWRNTPLDDSALFDRSRSGNGGLQGCVMALCVIGVLALTMFVLLGIISR